MRLRVFTKKSFTFFYILYIQSFLKSKRNRRLNPMKHKLEQQNVKEVFLKNICPFYRFSIFMLPRALHFYYSAFTFDLRSDFYFRQENFALLK